MNITLKTAELNPAQGALTAEWEFVPASPIEHELLAELLTDQALGNAYLHTTHNGERLGIKLIVSDPKAFGRAQHNLENLRRKDAGLPSLEEEAKAKADAEAAKAATEALAEAAAKAAAEEAEAKAAAEAAKAQAQQPPAEPAAAPRSTPTGKPKQSDK